MIRKSFYFNAHINILIVIILGCIQSIQYCYTKNNQLINQNCTGKELVTGMVFGSNKLTIGTARIVKSKADLKKVKLGDIIVTIMTQESWLPSLQKSSGIITNLGDSNCHAALYGKKNAIPVLVGAGNATEKIVDGNIIVMDCSQFLGRVYHSESNIISSPKSTVISHVDSSVKNLSQQNYYIHDESSSYLYQSHLSDGIVSTNLHITSDILHKHQKAFLRYVLKMQNELSWRSWIGEDAVLALARKVGGCGDFSLKCIPLVYEFFDQNKIYIESIIKHIEIEYINTLFEHYNQKPGDMEWLARVSHKEHIRKIALPADINKEELFDHPEKYKNIIDAKKVNSQERDILIASGLFVRYWVENKCKA